jgi:hypothetical protein
MPMGHCGRNRNTIAVHDIENVRFFFLLLLFIFLNFFYISWEGGEICAQKSIPPNNFPLPSGSNCVEKEIKNKIMKFHSTGRVGGY